MRASNHRQSKNKMRYKADNEPCTRGFLRHRCEIAQRFGHSKQKWITFCETMLDHGLSCSLYEARETRSKYITVSNGREGFRVRFSDHMPIAIRQARGDCDFFVGHSHEGITNTNQAIGTTLNFFKIVRYYPIA